MSFSTKRVSSVAKRHVLLSNYHYSNSNDCILEMDMPAPAIAGARPSLLCLLCYLFVCSTSLCALPLTKQAHAPLHHTTQATGTEILGRHRKWCPLQATGSTHTTTTQAPIQQAPIQQSTLTCTKEHAQTKTSIHIAGTTSPDAAVSLQLPPS